MTENTCAVCGDVFTVRCSEVRRGKGRTCSKSCATTGRHLKILPPPQKMPQYARSGEGSFGWKGGVSKQQSRYTRIFEQRHPEKARAYVLVRLAINRGDLVRQPCEVCGTTEQINAHHEDYSKPLDVMWLCAMHHRMHHGKAR